VSGNKWKAWLIPGCPLLALAILLVNSSLLARAAPSLLFYYFAVFALGMVLAWRFNSSRVLFSLLVLLLAHRAVEFFSLGQNGGNAGRTAAVLVALLIPLNFIALASMRERGLTVAGIAPRFGLLFLQSVAVAVLCRPESSRMIASSTSGAAIPTWALISFPAAALVMVVRFFSNYRLLETGSLWSLTAVFLWLRATPVGTVADAYVATAGLILVASLIETSYVLAYYDELTGIRGRRAFNEALLSLGQQYAIAIVDIDHFKKFNDTYGHDVGDQVLRLVASRLFEAGGSGQAYRCGGEEFAIIFRDTSAKDAFDRLDRLRQTIQDSVFRFRGQERRSTPRAEEGDRRKPRRLKTIAAARTQPMGELSVTVSIGVAEPGTRYREPEQVILAADKALYRAKRTGRNRVELASDAPLRLAKSKRATAARR
jgi:diguanylate cyclase (GGDEF)-like protein